MIVDCHTHWGICFQQRDGRNPSKWLGAFDRNGIARAIVLPFAGLLDGAKIQSDNDDVAAVCAMSGGRMIPFCTVNSWFDNEALAETERCLSRLGHRGIKFHPWLQGQSTALSGMDRVCEMAAHYRVPILFHDGTPPYSLPSQIALLARRHPRTQIILGHCGLLDHWREAADALNRVENLWGCLCCPHPAAIQHIVRHCDRARLLWGSDYGFTFQEVIEYRLGLMDLIGMDSSTGQMIFQDNPARLLQS
jgi:predicted TIM-barrel fold metal-dependent hydrolase